MLISRIFFSISIERKQNISSFVLQSIDYSNLGEGGILIILMLLFQLNYVYNSIEILQNRSDLLLLLLEEDFYLSPDALIFLQQMEKEKPRQIHCHVFLMIFSLLASLCPECLIYTLGNLEKSGKQFDKLSSKVRLIERRNDYCFYFLLSSKDFDCLLACQIQSWYDDLLHSMDDISQIC